MIRKNYKQGSLLIMMMLILFVVLIFITAAIWSIVCLNNLQKNENKIIKENIAINSLISCFNNTSMFSDSKANLRGALDILLNGENAQGSISFDFLNSSLQTKKYLILDARVSDTDGKAAINKKAFKPIPTFTYSHFVINPNEELGNVNVREVCEGIVRSNKTDNAFTNIGGSALKEKDKPYIYMQNISIDDYRGLANNYGLYIDRSTSNTDITVLFLDGDRIMVQPGNQLFNITQPSVCVIKNGGHKVRFVGFNSQTSRYSYIIPNHPLTIVCDSPIFIESDIWGGNGFIVISTFKDTVTETAFNMDINNYIKHYFIPDDINIDIYNRYYGIPDGTPEIVKVYLQSIFIALNGSFGFMENTFYGGINYNTDIVNQYNILGGIIEYNSNYSMKKFDSIPSPNPHLVCIRSESLLNIAPDSPFIFVAPPISSNIFAFSSKYF